ncbi:hypothetical protein DNTS_007697 [Danionella cerebrum]|uniref:Neuronal-specific septin-3 n=1 Tax=Danionella cerebrum TaxID=2873325 RepID=A0A553QRQ8_9TELE|nr:hypothetical protein DNTS_007697 [Danionella translucida]TRY92645.1 hypothetical protein DNTS_007697 [Danionella translucida]
MWRVGERDSGASEEKNGGNFAMTTNQMAKNPKDCDVTRIALPKRSAWQNTNVSVSQSSVPLSSTSFTPVNPSCPTREPSTSSTREPGCHGTPSVILKKPIHILSFTRNDSSQQQKPSILDTVDISSYSQTVKSIHHMGTTNKSLVMDGAMYPAEMCNKTGKTGCKISQCKSITFNGRRSSAIPMTNTMETLNTSILQQDNITHQQHNTLILCQEILHPKNLRHVESTRRLRDGGTHQNKHQSKNPILGELNCGLSKTGRIRNTGVQFLDLEKIREEKNTNWPSGKSPACSENPVKARRTQTLQKRPKVSAEGAQQLSKRLPQTNPIPSPKATNQMNPLWKHHNEQVPSLISANGTSNQTSGIASTSRFNQTSGNDPKIESPSGNPNTTTLITVSHPSNASNQCSWMSSFQFPLKSPSSSTKCGQPNRICKPMIKRTSDTRPTFFKTPQAWGSSSSQTGKSSNPSQNRGSFSDCNSTKSSLSETTLVEGCTFAKKHRRARLCKRSASSCPIQLVKGGWDAAAPPDCKSTNSEMTGHLPKSLFSLNQQLETKQTLHATDGDGDSRFQVQEDPLAFQPSVVTNTRTGAILSNMSEIVPPEVRPKPVVPAKPSHVAPPSSAPFVPSPTGPGGEGQGSGRGSTLFGYIGIDTIIEQMRKKTMKTGFDFNIMVVGQSGLGKSTLVNTLFKSQVSRRTTSWSRDEKIPKTVEIKSVSHVIEEGGVKMKLTVVDTPGFGDQINNDNCWEPISKYINEQYEKFLKEEVNIARKKRIPDTRVHCCLYFISPTGHSLRQLDVEFMKHLSRVVNIIPVIAKSDTLTPEEKTEFKQRVRKELEVCGIECYPQKEFDEDMEDKSDNDKIRETMPFAVVGSDKEYQVNGKRVLGRKTAWGVVEVENANHCEFSLLRDFMIRSHLQDLKEVTHNIHYETYRAKRLNDNGGLHPISSGQETQESNL